MSLVKKNVIANLVGSGWVALISIAFIPLYIHFMGAEAYGLIGFYLTLLSLFSVLDMGLTATVSRELARLSALENKAREMRNLVRTLEIIYWMIAILIIFVVTLIAPWLATTWLNASEISPETITNAIIIMSFVIAMRMPYGFYGGGILGLQRHVLLNSVKIGIETLKSGGAVLVLWVVSPTIITFFLWQAAMGVFGTCVIAIALWHCLPGNTTNHPSFQSSLFRQLWGFAAGMSAISVLSVILVQMDKVILSKMLSLESFAYYSLASTVSIGLYVIIGPVVSTMYPRFTELVTNKDEVILKDIYHKSCQLMAVLVMPIAILISFFSHDILYMWTRNEIISQNTAPILSLLVIGTAFNGMMNLPYALQIAHGWTKLAIGMNVIAILVLVPSLLLTVSLYESLGAAAIWIALNAGYILFGLGFMHRRVLKDELSYWYTSDFGAPSFVALVVVTCFWFLMPSGLGEVSRIGWILLAGLFSTGAAAFSAPALRKYMLVILRKRCSPVVIGQ